MDPQEQEPHGAAESLANIRTRASKGELRVTQHALQEMVQKNISLDEVLEAISTGEILENYPWHRRGPCCLLYGRTESGRDVHIVCTTIQPMLVIITAYEPRPPKWLTPRRRSGRT